MYGETTKKVKAKPEARKTTLLNKVSRCPEPDTPQMESKKMFASSAYRLF
jgi:hypothetical protein